MLPETVNERWHRARYRVASGFAGRVPVRADVDELFGRSEDSGRALHFWRFARLFAVWLRDQQRVTLVKNGEGRIRPDRDPGQLVDGYRQCLREATKRIHTASPMERASHAEAGSGADHGA